MFLQMLRVRDPDELAEGFRRWQLRFRQLGCGSFRGVLPHPFNLPAAGDGPSQSCRNPRPQCLWLPASQVYGAENWKD